MNATHHPQHAPGHAAGTISRQAGRTMNGASLITWNDRLALGLPEVDRDHRRLVSLINALAELYERDGDTGQLLTLFKQFKDYARTHFRTEEELMAEFSVSIEHRKAHVQAHAGFVAYLKQAEPVLSANPEDVLNTLLTFLMKWLAQHIAGLDARMAHEIAQQSALRGYPASIGAESDHAALENLFLDAAARNIELLDLNRQLLWQIEQKQQVCAALTASEARQHLAIQVFETMTEGVLVTDGHIRIESATPAFTRITGYSEDEVRGHSVFALISKHHDRGLYRRMRTELRTVGSWSGELWCMLKNGKAHPIWQNISALRNAQGDIIHYILVLSDMGEIHQARDTAERLSWRDPLTGLANRTLFMRELTRALTVARDEGRHGGVLLLNLDRFKMINVRGLAIGDTLLSEVAGSLNRLLYDRDLVARLNSDEFAVLLVPHTVDRNSVARSAQVLAERIHATLRAGVMLDDDVVFLEVSIGVTLFPDVSDASASDVLHQADLAMRQAKSGGGGHSAFFENAMCEVARESYELEHGLRNAVGQGQLQVYLQDQVDASGRRVGAEALVRWQHPERGLVSPLVFIPIAEKSDLIALIDRWVLEQVCETLVRPEVHALELDIAVNISPRHFRMSGFVDDIQAVLDRTGADPHRLVLEITEGLFIDDYARTAKKMNALRLLAACRT